ncbi:MAG: PQQ-binding-like beta-propeller repeat protein [Planctomycetes bacterium]|nr:PQQ-binding-like beta-propeller repeat protein [Planctomycetota bacterium]
MALRGDLASVDLAQVFQMLAMNQKVGLLSIQSKRLWKVLYFDQRGVTVHHNVHTMLDRVVGSFVRAGRLSEEAVEEVRDHAARMGQPLTDSLLAGGYLEQAELEEQYRFELEEEIYDLFFCRDARFEFFEGATALDGFDGQTDDRYLLNCDSVVMEAARRIDEWAYIAERIPSDEEFFVPVVDSIAIDDYGNDGAAIFELLDGRRSAGRLVELTGLAKFQAFKVLSQLLDAGAVAPVDDAELIDLGTECLEDGRVPDAIHLFERAALLGQGGPEVHSHAASAYRAAQRYEDAARHLEAEAEALVESGDSQQAAECLFEVRRMLPTALAARERLVGLALEHDVALPEFDAMAEGKEIVDLLLEFGDIERVRSLLERLLLVAPEDIDLKKALISVHVKAGDQQRVAELYESIAEDLVAAGNPLEAVGYLQKILLMDRSRTDISARVRELYESDERKRRRSRALGVLAFLFCLLIVVGAFYWFYNERANKEFASIDVRELLEHDDFAGAAIAYKDFIRKFPLTTAIAEAESELKRVEAARQRFEAELANQKAERDRELARIREEYQTAWKQHREQFLGGAPEAASATLARARELLAKANGPEDVAWALENNVERTWQRLQEYLAESVRLGEQYAEARQADDWQRARELAIELKNRFENTAASKSVLVPVMVRTRPPGARLINGGKPLEQLQNGEAVPLRTPALVYCAEIGKPIEIETDLEGFEPRKLTIQPHEQAAVEVVLAVVPERRIEFPTSTLSGIGSGEGWIAVGLRGGKLGVVRADGSGQRVVELGGLEEVASAPRIENGRVFFVNNENAIQSVALGSASPAAGWPVKLPSGTATELAIGGGRLAVVDGQFVLHCWEQAKATSMWTLSLDSAPSGPATFHKRQLFVGTNDGRVMIVDAADGSVVGVLRGSESISTRVLSNGETISFGCSSGVVRTVSLATGEVLWDARIGAPVVDGTMALGGDFVCCGYGKTLFLWDRRSGRELAKLALEGVVRPGMTIQGPRLLVRLQREKTRSLPDRDALVAVDLASASLLWEFEASGISPGPFAADNLTVAFPGETDEVVIFR